MRKRVLWVVAGTLAGEGITLLIRRVSGWHHFPDFSVAIGLMVLAYAEKTGRVPKAECFRKPISIFGGRVPRT